MRILLLSPQSFYIERGTPIAVKLLVSELAKIEEIELDLLTYPVGNECRIEGVNHYRCYSPLNFKTVQAGFSLKKVYLDFFLFFKALRLVITAILQRKKYKVIYAVEESVFFAFLFKLLFGINYVYDMDSSLRIQITEKYPKLTFFSPLFFFLEKLAVKNAKLVTAVCKSLEDEALKLKAKQTLILSDLSLDEIYKQEKPETSLRELLNIKDKEKLVVYVGNLEVYQGIDLLVESAKYVDSNVRIAIVGGSKQDIAKYQTMAKKINVDKKVFFIGPKPLKFLHAYLEEADILVSPRVTGNNVPMKIYSYMSSGTPIVATNIVSHTQVLDENTSIITELNSKDFANGVNTLNQNQNTGVDLASNCKAKYKSNHSYSFFKKQIKKIFNLLNS